MGWTGAKPYQYQPTQQLVSPQSGVPVRGGVDFLLALYNRTGAGTGSPNQVTQAPVAAAGGTLSTATLLTADWNEVNATANNQGVQIPAAMVPGTDIVVLNTSAHTVKVYPFNAESQIDALGDGAPYSLAAGDKQTFQCWTPTQLYSGS